ncbi:MAG: hypothetical protein B1H07_03575 [Campylobacteraceae bacterium 4484_166]|nr:MAG: hypothetical protein B1H07_03575 [Campylobacteraceae bacterium 4484_166]
MQTIQLDIKDNYLNKVIDFLKLLPESVVKIHTNTQETTQSNLSSELISRIDDIKSKEVKTISKDELFDGI